MKLHAHGARPDEVQGEKRHSDARERCSPLLLRQVRQPLNRTSTIPGTLSMEFGKAVTEKDGPAWLNAHR